MCEGHPHGALGGHSGGTQADGRFHKLLVIFAGALVVRTLLFGVYIGSVQKISALTKSQIQKPAFQGRPKKGSQIYINSHFGARDFVSIVAQNDRPLYTNVAHNALNEALKATEPKLYTTPCPYFLVAPDSLETPRLPGSCNQGAGVSASAGSGSPHASAHLRRRRGPSSFSGLLLSNLTYHNVHVYIYIYTYIYTRIYTYKCMSILQYVVDIHPRI